MTSSLLHGGRDELERLFDEVAKEFNRLGITGEVLMVRTPPPETIFLMKLQRASAPDCEDMIALWPLCSFGRADEVIQRFESAFPYVQKDDHLQSYVDDIISDATTAR